MIPELVLVCRKLTLGRSGARDVLITETLFAIGRLAGGMSCTFAVPCFLLKFMRLIGILLTCGDDN